MCRRVTFGEETATALPWRGVACCDNSGNDNHNDNHDSSNKKTKVRNPTTLALHSFRVVSVLATEKNRYLGLVRRLVPQSMDVISLGDGALRRGALSCFVFRQVESTGVAPAFCANRGCNDSVHAWREPAMPAGINMAIHSMNE